MTLPLTGPISFSNINTELGRTSSIEARLSYLETGVYVPLNASSPLKPNSAIPHSMSEWYGYNHSYAAYDSDAQAFIIAAGLTDTTQKNAINVLVLGLKSYSIWNKMYAIYPFVGGTAFSHKWNLKDPRDLISAFRLTFYGGLTHSSTGISPNGTSGYADTFFAPFERISQTEGISIGTYIRTNYIDSKARYALGCSTLIGGIGSGTGINIGYTSSSPQASFECDLENSTSYSYREAKVSDIIESGFRDTRGFWMGSQNITSMSFVKNNTVHSSLTFQSKLLSRDTTANNLVIFAQRYNGSIRRYSRQESAFIFIGSKLNNTQLAAYNYLVNQFQTTLGRNI